MEHLQGWTRRRWLGAAASAALALRAASSARAQEAKRSRVALAHDPAATVDFEPQADVVARMLASALCTVTGAETALAGLQGLFPPIGAEETIVVKLNSMGGPPATGNSAAATRALVQLLRELRTRDGAPVSAEQIIVWDNAPLAYLAEPLDGLCKVVSTYQPNQWDLDEAHPVILAQPPDESGFPIQRVLTDADHIISFGQLKAHPLTGTAGVLKNFFGAVPVALDLHDHGPWARTLKFGPWTLDTAVEIGFTTDKGLSTKLTLPEGPLTAQGIHDAVAAQCPGLEAIPLNYGGEQVIFTSQSEASELRVDTRATQFFGLPTGRCLPTRVAETTPGLYACEHIGPKVRLCLIDGLLAIWDKGPYHEPHEFAMYPERTPNTILASTDPVAIDAEAGRIIAAERAKQEKTEDAFDLGFLAAAEAAGLGLAKGYEVVEVGAA